MDNKVIDLTGLDTFKDKMDASVDEKIQNAHKNEVTGVKGNSESSYRTGNVNITPANIGLGNVGNYKAVSTVANQGLTDAEKSNARTNIGAGTSSFSGSYTDLTNKPTIPSVGNGTITIVQAGTTKGTFTTNQSGNTTIELSDNNTTYSVATQSANGLMSSADKKKLDGIATGAEVNQNAFSNVVVGSTSISADSKTDSLTLAGSNVTLTPDATNDKVTIGITKANVTSALGYTPPTTDTTYGVATTSANGLMSKDDKSKLDGITTGADSVSFSKNLTSGTKVGTITINGTSTDLYAPTNTDTKVTAVGNHYTPSADSNSVLSASASGASAAWSIDVVKGITLSRDAKGHVTGVSVTSGKIPANPNTDTKVTAVGNHYTPSGGTTISASGGTLTDITNSGSGVQVLTGVTKDAAGHVTGVTSVALKSVNTNTTYSNFVKSGSGAKSGLVPAPSTTAGTTKYLCEDGTWKVPTIPVLTADPKNPTDGQIWIKST